jgi:hypothetical protein
LIFKAVCGLSSFLQKVKAILHSKMADAFSLLVIDACIVSFVVVCIFKDEGVRSVDWFKKLWMIHHLLLPHPQKKTCSEKPSHFDI